jgi:ribosomal 50S subunit-recycling heat shock protein
MRLDLFLKVSRLCQRRAVAQQLCEAGLVSLNGRPAKSSHAVKPEDELVIRIRDRRLTVRVKDIPAMRSVSKADAANLVEILKTEDLSEG